MNELVLKFVTLNLNYGQSKKGLKMAKKSLCSIGYSLWYIKINPSQNQDLNTSLEKSYEELLSKLQLQVQL